MVGVDSGEIVGFHYPTHRHIQHIKYTKSDFISIQKFPAFIPIIKTTLTVKF